MCLLTARIAPRRSRKRRLDRGGDTPRRGPTRADLGTRGVEGLNALPFGRGGTCERFGPGRSLARDLRPPVREVFSDLELDRCRLHAAHLADQRGEFGGPAPGLSPEDHLKRFALVLVRDRKSTRLNS